MAKKVTIEDVVAQMNKHLGEGGSYYWKKYGLSRGTAFCAAGVSASFADASAKKYFYGGKPVFYVPYAQQWLKKNAKHVPLSDVRKGDIIIFTWDGNGYNKERGSRDHIGFARANSSGNIVYTIEANTNGGKVARKDRPAKYIYGIYRVNMASATSSTPTTTKKTTNNQLEVDGIFGVKTKKAMQKWLGVAEDGIIGTATTKALQKKVGAKKDGVWGAETTRKLQAYLTDQGFATKVDGVFGKNTTKALQKFLNKKLFSNTKSDSITPPTTTIKTDGMLKKVIDISAWQGKISVDSFKEAKADGVTGVILRSSYTTQASFTLNRDKVFENNIKNAKAAGLPVGVYHYSQAISETEAKKEAEYVVKIIKGMKLELPVAFDWEFGGRLSAKVAKKNGKAKNKKICDAFCNVIKKAGFEPMVYANLSTLTGYIQEDIYKYWKIWVAQYHSTCQYKHPRYLWQYTSSGHVNGLSGRIDMNKG